ncbi:MAG: hypothetical protein D6815_03485 [Candidatus Dadabacteria bacterium]|nr:MAG: hypothetical protein D6815_03485 [Candidatus Dadabacteria bacterium]
MDLGRSLKALAKADFADAVGVVAGDGAVALALVTKRFNRVEVRATSVRPLDVPDEGRWAVVAGMVDEFVREHRAGEARLAIGLAPRDALLGHLQLPAAAADSIDRVVGYELDRVLPVAPERVYVSSCARPLGRAGERVAVTVAAAPRERVEAIQRELAGAGLPPSAVTLAVAGLCDYYGYCRGEEAGTAGIFFRDGDRECMTLTDRGQLIASVHFDPAREARSDRLARELETVAPDLAGGPVELIIDGTGADEEVSLAAIAPASMLPAECRPDWLLAAAIGCALGQLGESRSKTNLLPAELARREESVGLRELGLAATVVVLALALVTTIAVTNLRIGNALAREIERLEPEVAAVRAQEAANRELLAKIEQLESPRKVSVLAYLHAMTTALPKTAYLTTFRFKGDRLEVDGIARTASELISILERSPYFKNVEFTAPTTKYLQDQERFSLRMELER